MLRALDTLSRAAGHLAAWLFALTGALLTYEVVARYFFSAPTVWAAEISELLLVWGSFLAMAYLLHRRQHIAITLLTGRLGPRGRRLADAFSLLFIAGLCLVVVWYGWDIAYDSLVKGRTTGTMLNIPNWWSEISVPLAFALLCLQCLGELARLARGETPPAPVDSETAH